MRRQLIFTPKVSMSTEIDIEADDKDDLEYLSARALIGLTAALQRQLDRSGGWWLDGPNGEPVNVYMMIDDLGPLAIDDLEEIEA